MKYRFAILDMDGVLWRGDQPIGNLIKVFHLLKISFSNFIFCTNNSTKSPYYSQQKLLNFGINFPLDRIITSSIAIADLLSHDFPERGNVFVIGEDGIREALKDVGFSIADHNPVAVVVGLDRNLSYQNLCDATIAIRNGVPFYGTNPDMTFPAPEGLVPGAGSIIELIRTSSGVPPIITGKPQPFMMNMAMKRMSAVPSETLVIGDRIDTDIIGGQKVGCPTGLVLSGVTTLDTLNNSEIKPDLVANDLTDLLSHL